MTDPIPVRKLARKSLSWMVALASTRLDCQKKRIVSGMVPRLGAVIVK